MQKAEITKSPTAYFMSAKERERAQDILLGALLGIILGLISGMWASIYDHLFLENVSKSVLIFSFIGFTLGLVVFGATLYWFAKRLGTEKHNPPKTKKE